MFIGHFGLALGAKKAAPAVLLLGYERVEIQPGITRFTPLNFVSYPYSHSLVALFVWGVAFGAIYTALRRARISAFFTIALLVISHWMLDYLTHRPDMPITIRGADRVGLGLWNSIPGTPAVEGAIFSIGLAVYLRETVPRDRIGSIGLWCLVGSLLVVYIASSFGPPPPTATAVA